MFMVCNKIQDNWDTAFWSELSKSGNTQLSFAEMKCCCTVCVMALWLMEIGALVGKEHLGHCFCWELRSRDCLIQIAEWYLLGEKSFQWFYSILHSSLFLCLQPWCQIQLHSSFKERFMEPLIAKRFAWSQTCNVKFICQNFPGRMQIYSKCSTESRNIFLWYISAGQHTKIVLHESLAAQTVGFRHFSRFPGT